jgi:hypothetical protein
MRAPLLFIAFLGFAFSAVSVQAAGFNDPKALVAAIYEPFTRHEQPADLQQFYSKHLKQLFAEKRGGESFASASLKSGSTGPNADFDPFVNASSYLLADLNISDPVAIGQRAMVLVSYHNFDHPSLLSLSLLKETDGWKVDDVSSLGDDQHWLLSWLLSNDPFEQ